MPFASNIDGPRDVILSEVSQRRRNVVWHTAYVESKGNDTNELTKQKQTH